MKGIDVSKWQGNINWPLVKADFAILRAGFGKETSQKDPMFETYYAGAKAANIPVGAYWYSYAKSVAEAKQEAARVWQQLRASSLNSPSILTLKTRARPAFPLPC